MCSSDLDRIYPQYIWNSLPVGVAGLVIAAILAAAMSNLSAALNSLASTTIMAFYKLRRQSLAEGHYLKLARIATLVWGGVLLGIGILARHVDSVLEAGLGIASILYGALLGVFLLGLLNKRASERSAMIGMTAGIAVNLLIAINKFTLWFPPIAWTWYVLIGATLTIAVSLAASAILDREKSVA